WLPTRVASNLDLAANAFGALLGAALIAPATGAFLDRGLLRRVRLLWFRRDIAAKARAAAARAVVAGACRADGIHQDRRDVSAIGSGACVQLGDARRSRRP